MLSSCAKDIRSPSKSLQLVSNQFSFTEGPIANKQGVVYFTDQPENKIYSWSEEEGIKPFTDESRRSNGMFFDNKGRLLSCADENTQLIRFNENAEISVLAEKFDGNRFNGPNDLWVAPNDDIYFTDPFYARPWWNYKTAPQKVQGLYYLKGGIGEPQLVDANFVKPNGIVGTADGRILYVADIGDKKTYRYERSMDGQLINRQLFTNLGSDGMTIDNKGNVYLTGDGVIVFNEKGQQIDHIKVPEKWTANVCFGGKKNNKLFITASKSVYTLEMKVRGNR